MTNQPNTKLILRAYGILQQLTPDDLLVLELLRNLSETERELLVETLAPQKSPTKRAGKKSASKASLKSSRASSLAEQIKSGRIVAIDMASKEPICSTCGNVEDFEDHFKPSPHYHEFDAGKSPAPRAGARSSTNGSEKSSILNSVEETVSAGAVAGGSSD